MRRSKSQSRRNSVSHSRAAARSKVLAAFEPLEVRRLLSATLRSVDGSGNNLAHTSWGQAGTDLIRVGPVGYADGVSSPSLPSDQSARTISNDLNSQASTTDPTQDQNTVDGNSLSDFGYAFGQFMDHDMDLTPDGGSEFDIAVSASDPIGPDALAFTRSQYDASTGTSTSNPRQQVTDVTSYLDLSQVYGSSQAVSDALRTFSGGQLKTSPGNMLPYDNTNYFTPAQITALNMENDSGAVSTDKLFAAGDVRANENVELTVIQTLFMRNHNLIASELRKQNPTWSDEQLYQDARKLNIAEYQSIVYNEYLPAVYGARALPAYRGYNPNVNATIANEFSTVAFRMGHSMVSPEIERLDNSGEDITDDISLADDFFDPNLISSTGAVDPLTGLVSTDIGPVLKGEASGNGQAMDMMVIGDIRNLLFANGGNGGDDLIARDVQRGRDNGIASYNALRVSLGLRPAKTFADITPDVTVQRELAAAYPGGVNTVDAFEGGLAEPHVAGSDVGALFQAISVNQFERLRDGDRFFYLNETFTPQEQAILSAGSSFTKVIEANTPVTGLQADAMYFRASAGGAVASGPNRQPLAGVTLQLKDSDGDVVATAQTDRNGHYVFTEQSTGAANDTLTPGLSSTGDYSVSVVLPNGATAVSAATLSFSIQTGDESIGHLDFQLNAKAGPGQGHGSGQHGMGPAAVFSTVPISGLGSAGDSGTTNLDSLLKSGGSLHSDGRVL